MRTAILALLLLAAPASAQHCYRPSYYSHSYGQYYQNYYYPQYVYYAYPVVLEVQVYKDRYYSLSELNRDRVFLAMWDEWKAYRQGREAAPSTGASYDQPGQARSASYDQPGQARAEAPRPAPAASPKGRVALGKTGPRAAAILKESCLQCHDGNPKLDLSNLDVLTTIERSAAWAMMVSRDMPLPPKDFFEADGKVKKGKEAELEKWRAEHAIKEEDLKIIYDEWIMPARIASAKR